MTERAVLVLREPDEFTRLLASSGVEVVNLQIITTRPVTDLSELQQRIIRLDDYDGCFFTSPAAAEIFVQELKAQDRSYQGKFYVLGNRAKDIFEKAGLDVQYRRDANTADEFVASFPMSEFSGRRFLFVRGDNSIRTVPEMIGDAASVDETVVYNTVGMEPDTGPVQEIRERLESREIGWACFFSPSAVDRFQEIFEASDLSGVRTAAIGKTTAQRIIDAGLTLDFISSRASASAFAAEFIEHIKSID